MELIEKLLNRAEERGVEIVHLTAVSEWGLKELNPLLAEEDLNE